MSLANILAQYASDLDKSLHEKILKQVKFFEPNLQSKKGANRIKRALVIQGTMNRIKPKQKKTKTYKIFAASVDENRHFRDLDQKRKYPSSFMVKSTTRIKWINSKVSIS